MRVHHHDTVVVLDDGRVAVDLVGGRGHRHVHAVGDFLEVEPRVASIRSLMRTAVHRCLLFWWGAPIWPPTPPTLRAPGDPVALRGCADSYEPVITGRSPA